MDSEARPARFPLPGGLDNAAVRVHPVVTGERHAKPRFGLGGGSATWVLVAAYLVEHPGAGRLLIDTGLHPSVAHDPAQNLGRTITRRQEYRMDRAQALDEQLRTRGLDAGAIRTVLMTHLHAEQASGAQLLPEASFLLDAREWRAAAGNDAGYHARLVDFPFDWRAIDYDEPHVDAFATFGRSIDVFGDGSVRLLSTPGHSPGHQSVLLRLPDGREALICGDAAATLAEVEGAAPAEEPADEHLHRRSLSEIRRFAEMTPSALIVPGHDPEAAGRAD
ncbi:MAG TPA: N-acyl homoserine lactonase family protein [Solirubrobacteraceae bacterium]|jgi:glyoxylase-like metal-dependent hydrolase (beta-lactamase superfamily II)